MFNDRASSSVRRRLVTALAVLAGIVYEDFKFRRVRFAYFIILVPLLYFQNYLPAEEQWPDIGINLLYLSVLMLSVAGFGYFKTGTVRSFSSMIGLGDILLLLSLTVWLNPVMMIIFNSVSFMIALLLHLLLGRFAFYTKFNTIPLAGMQGICFLPVFLYIGHLDTSWIYEFYN